MKIEKIHIIKDLAEEVKWNLFYQFSELGNFILLDSCQQNVDQSFYSEWDWLIGFGNERTFYLDEDFPFSWGTFLKEHRGRWSFGVLSYELKNQLENLQTRRPLPLNFPKIYWYVPQWVIGYRKGEIFFYNQSIDQINKVPLQDLITINRKNSRKSIVENSIILKPKISKEEYLTIVSDIKKHIQAGDVYELNFCMNFFCENAKINPTSVWHKLVENSPMPYSAYFHTDDFAVLSASPERFLKIYGQEVIAQPMKGTIKRGTSPEEDELQKIHLQQSEKEQSENVMIVDLMRNDLSKTAKRGSVNVKEIFGVQTFSSVHQMISTIVAEKRVNINNTEVIASAFPMGSMTGAPKIKAMQLIDQYESSGRGLFSGSLGYCDPDGNMDMNVLIRTLFYHKKAHHLSAWVGSAITVNADPEREYEECCLKIQPILKSLSNEK